MHKSRLLCHHGIRVLCHDMTCRRIAVKPNAARKGHASIYGHLHESATTFLAMADSEDSPSVDMQHLESLHDGLTGWQRETLDVLSCCLQRGNATVIHYANQHLNSACCCRQRARALVG